MATFVVEVHHNGYFMHEPYLQYIGGKVDRYTNFDPDYWSFFEVIDVVKQLGYYNYLKLWGRDPTKEVGGYRAIESDKDVMELASLLSDKMTFEIYVEHECEDEAILLDNDSEALPYMSGCESEFEDGDKVLSNIHIDKGVEGTSKPLDIIRMDDNVENNDRSDIDSSELLSLKDSSDSEDGVRTKYPIYREITGDEKPRFELGITFNSLSEFKNAVDDYAVKGGRQIRFVKNDKTRVRAKCMDGCKWLAYVAKVQGEMTYQLKTFVDEHSCSRCFNNPRLTSRWLSRQIVNDVKEQPDMRLSAIQEKVQRKYISQINKVKASRAKKLALDIVHGSHKEQYSRLWEYCEEIRRSNPGSSTLFNLDVRQEQEEVDGQPLCRIRTINTFQRLYICLDGCRRGFIAGCRPFIGLDACHLKGPYGGQLIAAVGRDPNDQYFPLAFAVVEAETKDSWTWFLTKLLVDIGSKKVTFISDQQKGLVPTFNELIPKSEHRFCVRHIYSNMRKRFPGKQLKELFWRAANATYYQQWEREMQEMKKVDEGAYKWVLAFPREKWSKHAFSCGSKCDSLVNNLCEVFNATILEARDQPIISLCEWIRTYLMRRFQSNRDKIEKFEGEVCPKIKKKIEGEKLHSRNWLPVWAGDLKFEARNGWDKFVVDLDARTCSCRKWDLTGLPCQHAISCIFYKGHNVETYVDDCYKKKAYIACYKPLIYPTNGPNLWPSTNFSIINPPHLRRAPGRPKKLRKREPDEPKKGSTVGRRQLSMKCSKCNQYGHNKRSCKGSIDKEKLPQTLQGSSSSQTIQVSSRSKLPIKVRRE